MAQAFTVQAPSLRPTVSSSYRAVPVRFRVTLAVGCQADRNAATGLIK